MADIVNVSAALRTTTGTQDYTSPGFGTPKAAKFFITIVTSNGVPVTHALYGIGCTDGTRQIATSFRGKSGVATPTVHFVRRSTATDCIFLTDSDGVIIARAQFSSWITDGVRINVSLTSGVAYAVTCVLYGGTGILNARVDTFSAASVADGFVTVTPGFQFSYLETFLPGTSGFLGGAVSHIANSLGFCHNDGTNPPPQWNIGQLAAQSSSPQSVQVAVISGMAARETNSNARIEIRDVTSTNFRAYTRHGGTPPTINVGYLAIRLHSSITCKILQLNSPVATGSHTFTGVGFSSQHACLLLTGTTNLETTDGGSGAEPFGVSVISSESQFCHAISVDDNVTTTIAQTNRNSKAVQIRQNNAILFDATLTNFTSDGVTLNFTSAPATIARWVGLFIQAQSPVLESTASGRCGVNASLTTSIRLSVTPSGKCTVSAGLETKIALSSDSECRASALVSLSTTSLLSVAAVGRCSAHLLGGDLFAVAIGSVSSAVDLIIGFSWTEAGFNFRKTSGYVSDSQSEVPVLGHFFPRDYTVNGQLVQAGWVGSGPTLIEDRDNVIDRRLAGVNGKLNSGSQVEFRILLSQFGNWLISIAAGDAGAVQGYQYIQFLDNAIPFLTLENAGGTSEDQWMAVDGSLHSDASWVSDGSNITVARGFSDPGGPFGLLSIVIGSPIPQGGSTTLSHVKVSISPNQGAILQAEASCRCSVFSLIEAPFSASAVGVCSTSARFGIELLASAQGVASVIADISIDIALATSGAGKCSVSASLATSIYTLLSNARGSCQVRRKESGLFATWNMQTEADLHNFYVTVATQSDGVPFIGMVPILRSNILLQSDNLQALPWGKDGCFVHRNAATHKSTTDGFELVESLSTGVHRIYQAVSFVSASDYSFSVYLRKGLTRYVRLRLIGPSAISYSAEFDLEAGVVTPGSSGSYPGTTSIMQSVENGYRCTVSGMLSIGSGFVIVELVNSSHESVYAGYGVNGVYVWNPQLTLGVSPLRYVGTLSLQRIGHFAAFTPEQTYYTRVYAVDTSLNLSPSSTEVPFTIPVELVTNIQMAASASGKASTSELFNTGGSLFLVSAAQGKVSVVAAVQTSIQYQASAVSRCIVSGILEPSPAAVLQSGATGKCSVSASLLAGIGFIGQPSCRCFTIGNLTGTSASTGLLQDNVNERFEERGMERGIFDGGG